MTLVPSCRPLTFHRHGWGLHPKRSYLSLIPAKPGNGYWYAEAKTLTVRKRYRGALRRTAKTSRRRNTQRRACIASGVITKSHRRNVLALQASPPPVDPIDLEPWSQPPPRPASDRSTSSSLFRFRSSFWLSAIVFLWCITDAHASAPSIRSVASRVVRGHPIPVCIFLALVVIASMLRLCRVCSAHGVGRTLPA
jgi:hypothetical protein